MQCEGGVGWDVEERCGGQIKGAIWQRHTARTGLDVKRVLVRIGSEGRLIDRRFEGDEELRKLGSHRWGDHHKGSGIDPTGELRGHMAIGGDEGVAGGDNGASLAEEFHSVKRWGAGMARERNRQWPGRP
jgi:hypothetical protein